MVVRLSDSSKLDRSLCGREPGDRYSERRAAHIVHSDLMTEFDAVRIAAVFAADADLQLRLDLTAAVDAHSDEFADPVCIYCLKWIVRQYLQIKIFWQESADIITAKPKAHLRQIVCTVAEEISLLSH